MKKQYQFRVDVGPFDFVFAVGAEALSFVRTAVEHFSPDKYYDEVPTKITIEKIPEERSEPEPEFREEDLND